MEKEDSPLYEYSIPFATRSASNENALTNNRLFRARFDKRELWVLGGLGADMVEVVTMRLKELADVSSDPVTVFIDSPGGWAFEGFGLYDAIRSCPLEVRTVNLVVALSAAAVLFLAGDRRYCYPHSSFMFHCIARSFGQGASESVVASRITADYISELTKTWIKNVKPRLHASEELWRTLTESSDERWLGAEEALEWGLVHEILPAKGTA